MSKPQWAICPKTFGAHQMVERPGAIRKPIRPRVTACEVPQDAGLDAPVKVPYRVNAECCRCGMRGIIDQDGKAIEWDVAFNPWRIGPP